MVEGTETGGRLYMIIERFRTGRAEAVYARFRERGRMLPDGVVYVDSWVTDDRAVCYQLMRSPGRSELDEWMARWSDLVEFEVVPVITSAEAASRS